METAGAIAYGFFSNSETANCVKQESGCVCKIHFQDLNKGD